MKETFADTFYFLAVLNPRDADTDIVASDTQLLTEGIELYRNRPDKDWPLTDCLSFAIMTRRGIADALTGDDHFRQAGFNPLLGS
jgi:predicted nucleic acid-binding protein